MLRPTIALHWATSVLFLLLLQETTHANVLSRNFNDTVYLDRNGKEIKSAPGPGTTVTFLVKTILTTDMLFGTDSSEINNDQRGKSHPISEQEADRVEDLIKKGDYNKAIKTGNLVKLRPLAERQTDGKIMLQDSGGGKDTAANNREYATVLYKNGTRKIFKSPVGAPSKEPIHVDVPNLNNTITYTHSHPSGYVNVKMPDNKTKMSFYQQPPSKDDIALVPAGVNRIVFGRGSKLVYIYDGCGVIAVLATEDYMSL
jgi:hypothetical protein